MIQKPEIQCDATTAQERGAEDVAKTYWQSIRVISEEKRLFFPSDVFISAKSRSRKAEKPTSRYYSFAAYSAICLRKFKGRRSFAAEASPRLAGDLSIYVCIRSYPIPSRFILSYSILMYCNVPLCISTKTF